MPPLVVCVNDADQLPEGILEKLLGATKRGHELVTEPGWIVECHWPCWIFCTTDSTLTNRKLFHEVPTLRFDRLSAKQVAQVVKKNYSQISNDACELIAQHVPTPKQAGDVVREILIEKEMNPHRSWIDITQQVLADHA